MIKRITPAILLLLLITHFCRAQSPLPVLHAGAGNLDIRDGDHFRKKIWTVMPEKKPDHYYVEIPRRPHRVTFYSGRDSVSFITHYGQTYNFVILRGKDSCYTQLLTNYKV